MPRYKCIVEYDGGGFAGWQRQPDQPTIQGEIEQAIYKLSGVKLNIFCAGRTDAGVHAYGQVMHFDLDKEFSLKQIMDGTNFHLRPRAIAITSIEQVDESFHARFSANKRYYQYRIINRVSPLAIDRQRAWHVIKPLDVKLMADAAEEFIGEHDFNSFRSVQCQSKSSVKTIDDVAIVRNGDDVLLSISAKSFLHHMVRNITGTLVHVGTGKWSRKDVVDILHKKDRRFAGPTAPAHGLFFMRVDYN